MVRMRNILLAGGALAVVSATIVLLYNASQDADREDNERSRRARERQRELRRQRATDDSGTDQHERNSMTAGATAQAGTGQNQQASSQRQPATRPSRHRLTISGRSLLAEPKASQEWEFVEGKHSVSKLHAILEQYTVFLLIRVDADEEEQALRTLLEPEFGDAMAKGRLVLLCCDTVEGQAHMSRHLNPLVHIDGDRASFVLLEPHIPYCLFVGKGGSGRSDTGAASASSTAQPAATSLSMLDIPRP
eukprot:Clim_evm38s239 gene=Clim_evmTU38s239